MKISILTATYNRSEYLDTLYQSLIKNSNFDVKLEWLIMDEGSTDDTKDKIESYSKNSLIEIKYFFQENQGKMTAINNLVGHVTGDLIIECDSDDCLSSTAIKVINEKYSSIENTDNIYALVFLKYNHNFCNIGTMFKEDEYMSTMFDLYFKDGITGDKALVFISDIRKRYTYIIEENEKFGTQSRMYNQMDKSYNIMCFNHPIMICTYLDEEYSKNIFKLFMENPNGHYEYFKAMFDFDMKGVLLKKRLYIIKHYILFSYITKQKNVIKKVKGNLNKFLTTILFIPGFMKSSSMVKKYNDNINQ